MTRHICLLLLCVGLTSCAHAPQIAEGVARTLTAVAYQLELENQRQYQQYQTQRQVNSYYNPRSVQPIRRCPDEYGYYRQQTQSVYNQYPYYRY